MMSTNGGLLGTALRMLHPEAPLPVRDAVVVFLSDFHFGSTLSPWPPEILLEDGTVRAQNVIQQWVKRQRDEFIGRVDDASKGKRRIWLFCGDGCEGNRKMQQLVTPDQGLQQRAYLAFIKSVLRDGDIPYIIRGTEWHVGPLAVNEERVACDLYKDFKTPQEPVTQAYSRYEVNINVNGVLFNAAHHIGTTRSPVSEATALTSQLVKAARSVGRWGGRTPDVMARAHRHQFCMVWTPGQRQGQCIFTLPSWCAKGEYTYKIDNVEPAQVGGAFAEIDKSGFWQIHPYVWAVPGPNIEEM